MAIQTINLGTSPNDDTGDPARTAFTKLNANFTDNANAASKLVATPAQAVAGTAGVLPDAAGVHSAIRGLAVGTVSQSGGVPTGAIIQRGSNANGEFVRFADGTQICLIRTGLTEVTGSGGRYDVTYPIAFSNATSNFRVAFGSEDQGNSFTRFYNTTSVTTQSATSLSAYLGVSSIAYPIRYTVIGRWY